MVRVLVATSETQGLRASDFSWVPDGEILCWGFACDRDRDNIDGGCGCRRSLSGVFSRRATTTFKVAEIDDDAETLYRLYERSYHEAGFPLTADDIRALCTEMLEVAAHYPFQTILEKRGEAILPRRCRPRTMWDEEDLGGACQ